MNYRRLGRAAIAAAIVLWLGGAALGETLITDAKISEVKDHGFVLAIGSEMVPVEDGYGTHYWAGRAKSNRAAFQVGEDVTVRVKTDAAPAELREMSDRPTWKWLDRIRKDTIPIVVKDVQAKTLTASLDDGSTFEYRWTQKTEVTLRGARVTPTELKPGQRLFAKARTLPSLETFLAKASDDAGLIVKKATKAKRTRAKKLPGTGGLVGNVLGPANAFSMFDIMSDNIKLHITFTPRTAFKLDGGKVTARDVAPGQEAHIAYSRDRFGRIIASKVELFSHH